MKFKLFMVENVDKAALRTTDVVILRSSDLHEARSSCSWIFLMLLRFSSSSVFFSCGQGIID